MTAFTELVKDTVETMVVDGTATLNGDLDGHGGAALANMAFPSGLATAPRALARRGLGLVASLIVPPGTWAVVHLPGGERRVYTPGSYTMWGTGAGAILAQWVDARRRQVSVGPIEGWSADKWRVRLWLAADVEVAEPVVVAMHREPLATILAALRAGAFSYIERHSHAAITGAEGALGGVDAPAQAILERMRADSTLEGLRVIGVRVTERQGDERQIEASTAATVAAAQVAEEIRVSEARNRARLHQLESQAILFDREHSLRMAATAAQAREQLLIQQSQVQQAAQAARLEIVLAQIHAQTAEIARDEQQWQAEHGRLQGEWEHAQQQVIEAHRVDQHLRLMDGQRDMLRSESEVALGAEERRHTHELALAEVQERLAQQRALQSQAIGERRAQHDRALFELHLRHEQIVAEQLQSLEQWRSQQRQLGDQQQRQHEKQLAAITGTAQIAAAAASHGANNEEQRTEVADTGLRALQDMAE